MTLTLHDLACVDDRRPSPFCWRIKFALAHKRLPFDARPVGFTGIRGLCGGEGLFSITRSPRTGTTSARAGRSASGPRWRRFTKGAKRSAGRRGSASPRSG
ncbi:uncharacterized protein CMC5_079270 [Chondromyces crocatus]|uniref:Uncharacterized protein n=1 Tax=Chondromyces crocatus TaxID=52 RepID=A0A0K1ESS9_CHOCO|nr:uncharacterized protein CMC5_079270 [Chondromyces crocatus]